MPSGVTCISHILFLLLLWGNRSISLGNQNRYQHPAQWFPCLSINSEAWGDKVTRYILNFSFNGIIDKSPCRAFLLLKPRAPGQQSILPGTESTDFASWSLGVIGSGATLRFTHQLICWTMNPSYGIHSTKIGHWFTAYTAFWRILLPPSNVLPSKWNCHCIFKTLFYSLSN